MGALGRFACILTPMICTLASLLALLVLLAAGTKKSVLPSVYYIKLDVRRINFQGSIDIIPGKGELAIPVNLTTANAKDLGLNDFYTSYLWNFCAGTVKNENEWPLDHCNKSSATYTFDVEKIVDLEAKDASKVDFPSSVRKVQKAVNTVSRFMMACYALAGVATLATFIIGWFGLLSRWGSCVTSIFANAAFVFLLAASICVTSLAYAIKGAFNKAFDSFGVEATVGRSWISATWVATLFSFGAAVFWMMSMCCCSGRRDRVMSGKTEKKKPKGSYSRLNNEGSAKGGVQPPVPMHSYGFPQENTAYEPMRHGKV